MNQQADARTRTPRRRALPRRWVVLLAAWAALFVICTAWALATPVSGSPDESSHIVKAAATARGMLHGTPFSPGVESFILPGDVGDTDGELTCFAFRPDLSAACAPSLSSRSAEPVEALSGVGSYNPLYYALVGWPSLFISGLPMVIAMRLMSALLSSFFLAVIISSAAQLTRLRAVVIAAVAVAFTPMVCYLGGVVNPNGLEIATVGAITALGWLLASRQPDVSRREITVLLVLAIVLAANLRATSPIFILVALVPALIALGWSGTREFFSKRFTLIAAGIALLAVIAGATWSLLIGLKAGFIPSSEAQRDGVIRAFVNTLDRSEMYFRQLVGDFGWLDTGLSPWFYPLWAALVGVVVILALGVARRRMLVALAIPVLAYLLGPAILQAPTVATYGYIWQGRYSLPLLLSLVVAAGFLLARTLPRSAVQPTRRLGTAAWALAVVLGTTAFYSALRRFVTGTVASGSAMFTGEGWAPPLPWPVLVAVFVVGSAALAALAIRLIRSGNEPAGSGGVALGGPGRETATEIVGG